MVKKTKDSDQTKNELIRLHDLGFDLILLRPKSKKPFWKEWSESRRKTKEELLKEYTSGHNIGMRLGHKIEDHYLECIDMDIKSNDPRHLTEALNCLYQEFPELKKNIAPQVESGRGLGSSHFYVKTRNLVPSFEVKKSFDTTKVKIDSKVTPRDKTYLTDDEINQGFRIRPAWEISFMSKGKQCVLPPSVHPDSGDKYRWKHPLTSLDEIPVLTINKRPSTLKRNDHSELKIFNPLSNVIINGRGLPPEVIEYITDVNDEPDQSALLMSITMKMIRAGFSEDEIITVMTDKQYPLAYTSYKHAQSDNQSKAAYWFRRYTYRKAHEMLSPQYDFSDEYIPSPPLSDEEAQIQYNELFDMNDWKNELDRTKEEKPKETLKNIVLIMRKAVSPKIFQFDKFKAEIVYGETAPWRKDKRIGDPIDDSDIAAIAHWFSKHYRIEVSDSKLYKAITDIAKKNEFHPVQNYLHSLKWDEKSRVENIFTQYLKSSSGTAYLRSIAKKFLSAMVARILDPGVKFDSILILEGQQGIGKSSFAKILGGDWFSDAELTIGDKDSVQALMGNWVIELGELSSLKKADTDKLKAFITRSIDKIRVPYGRHYENFPRQCVFIGTTNSAEYLKDTTGNRRFWPVKVLSVDVNKLKEDRDQIFAEAVCIYQQGEHLFLSKEENELASLEQSKRVVSDPWEELIFIHLAKDKLNGGNLYQKFRMADLFSDFGPLAAKQLNTSESRRVGAILRLLGYDIKHSNGINYWLLKDDSRFRDLSEIQGLNITT